jgi:hypothetical protein
MFSRSTTTILVIELSATMGLPPVLAADQPTASDLRPPPSVLRPLHTARTGETPIVRDASDLSARASEHVTSFTPSPEFQRWVTSLVREHLPADYEQRKNWGHTAKTFDGISIKLEDGRIKTHRRFKDANDGQWQMYRIALNDPQQQFDVQISNLRMLADGKVGLEIAVDANLTVFGRQSQWEHGVQLYSLSAEADARVRLWATAEIATRLDPTRFPPDIYLQPEITAARFEIPDFRLRRLGELQGPLVRSLSHTIREVLEEKLADDNQKIVARLNRSIDKQEPRLKLSMSDLLKHKLGGLAPPAAR